MHETSNILQFKVFEEVLANIGTKETPTPATIPLKKCWHNFPFEKEIRTVRTPALFQIYGIDYKTPRHWCVWKEKKKHWYKEGKEKNWLSSANVFLSLFWIFFPFQKKETLRSCFFSEKIFLFFGISVICFNHQCYFYTKSVNEYLCLFLSIQYLFCREISQTNFNHHKRSAMIA